MFVPIWYLFSPKIEFKLICNKRITQDVPLRFRNPANSVAQHSIPVLGRWSGQWPCLASVSRICWRYPEMCKPTCFAINDFRLIRSIAHWCLIRDLPRTKWSSHRAVRCGRYTMREGRVWQAEGFHRSWRGNGHSNFRTGRPSGKSDWVECCRSVFKENSLTTFGS